MFVAKIKTFLCLQKDFSGQILTEMQVSWSRRNTKTQEGFLLINYYSVTSFRSEISGEAIRE